MKASFTLASVLALTSASAFAQPQIQIEYVGENEPTVINVPVEEVEATAMPKAGLNAKKWIEANRGGHRFGAGLGYRIQNGNVTTSGMNAQMHVHGYGNEFGNDAPNTAHFGHANVTFNMFNKEKNGPRNLSSGIDFDGNVIYGFSPIDDSKADFFIGGSGNLSVAGAFYSNMRAFYAGSAGIDTGLAFQNDVVTTLITGSVTAGGVGCEMNLPDGSVYKFTTDAWGFGTQFNLVVGDKIYLNARYTAYPKKNTPDFSNSDSKATSGDYFKATAAVELSEKILLKGSCQIVNLVNQGSVRQGNNNVAGPINKLNYSMFQIGVIRTFSSNSN